MLPNDGLRRSASRSLAALLFGALLLTGIARANEEVELRLKAAYLLNFARFIDWPQPATPATEPIVIGIFGPDQIQAALEATVQGKTVNGHPIKIRVFASADPIDRCDVLFFPRGAAKQSAAILTDLLAKPVLTVGESSGFMKEGGMIEFQTIEDTLRFSVNVGAADKAGLKVKSDLLSVAYSLYKRSK